MATIEELEKRLLILEDQVKTLMEEDIKQKGFQGKFEGILSLEVSKTENGRIGLKDNGTE